MSAVPAVSPLLTPLAALRPPEPASRRYRGALIGLGSVARLAHLPALLGDADVCGRLELVATVDRSGDVVAAEGVPILRDRRALAELPGTPLDFVVICTPTASHRELTLWALDQGYHVLCEKPVATTVADAAAIAAAARRAGRVVMPCHQYRHNPAWRRIREWLASGAIGQWRLAEFRVYRPAADPGRVTDGTPWRGTLATGGGGVLVDHGAHLMYQLLDVAGPPEAVRGWTGRLRHADYDVEDSAQLLFEYPTGVASIFLTWAAHRRETHVRFVGDTGTIEWTGGVLRVDRDGRVDSLDYSAALDKAAYAGWFAPLFREFASALDGADGAAQLEDIRQVAELLETSYAAARSGRRVPLGGAHAT
jgi:predicted dehydrogenase